MHFVFVALINIGGWERLQEEFMVSAAPGVIEAHTRFGENSIISQHINQIFHQPSNMSYIRNESENFMRLYLCYARSKPVG